MNHRFFSKIFLLAITSAVLFNTPLSAQSLASWGFNASLSGVPGAFNTVSTAGFGPAIPSTAFNGATEYYGQDGWPTGALNTGAYLQFSLTPAAGYQLDLTSIVLRMRRSNTGSPSGSGPTSWSVRSSLDGYSADVMTGTMNHNYANYTVPLSVAFHSVYSTITFRVYGYAATTSAGGSSRMVFDQVTVSGLNIVLPVRLGGVTVEHAPASRTIKFTAMNSNPLKSYTVERSADGQFFDAVKQVQGTTDADVQMVVNDSTALESHNYFYRVRVSEEDGSAFYSGVVYSAGKRMRNRSISVHSGNIYLPAIVGHATLSIYAVNGAMLYTSPLAGTGHEQQIHWPLRSRGVFVVVLKTRDTNISTQIFAD